MSICRNQLQNGKTIKCGTHSKPKETIKHSNSPSIYKINKLRSKSIGVMVDSKARGLPVDDLV
jgi:hypothetical protein